jgi:NADH:ubiquinone oxidoreductase subunit 6 (subunit J)
MKRTPLIPRLTAILPPPITDRFDCDLTGFAVLWPAIIAELSPATGTTPPSGGPLPMILFYMIGGMAAGGAIAVAACRNIIHAAVGLLFSLIGVAGIFFLLGAEFLAAVQLVVYVGGTLILLIFGVMLTSRSADASYRPTLLEIVWACAMAFILAATVGVACWHAPWLLRSSEAPLPQSSVEAIGQLLIGPRGMAAPFELISVLLVAVMIGAAFIARPRRSANPGSLRPVGSAAPELPTVPR